MNNTAILDYNDGRAEGIRDVYEHGIDFYFKWLKIYKGNVREDYINYAFYRGYQDAAKHLD